VKAFAKGRCARFREKHGIAAGAFVVGHLGRLAPEKNLDYLARALCRFLQQSKAMFLVVGDGPSAPDFRQFFEWENLTDRLVMVGKKTGRDLYDAYAAMDVFAFASRTETQGLVVAEAMAAGLPVVALDASGVREVVRDGSNGFLLHADASEDDFAARLKELETSDELRSRFSAQAKETATMFSCNEIADKALALYRRLLRKRLRTRAEMEDDPLKSLFKRIEVEWTLVSQKAGAVLKAITGETERSGRTENVAVSNLDE
jgi:1,2-diacylglycerol 3-alpha-glucosyltransferase